MYCLNLFCNYLLGIKIICFVQAREYFEKAAENKEPGGHYNLGVLYLKGIGMKKDVTLACKYFLTAANAGQPKALYQVAKLFQKGIGLKKNLLMVFSFAFHPQSH